MKIAISPGFNILSILSLTAFSEFQKIDSSVPFIYLDGNDRRRVEMVINELIVESSNKIAGSQTVMKGYLTVLLAYIFRNMLGEKRNFKEIPEEITEYISAKFNEKLSIEHLAKKCFYSPKYFKKYYDTTPHEYRKSKKL